MQVRVEAKSPSGVAVDLLAVPIRAAEAGAKRLTPRLRALDRAAGGVIASALESDFKGRVDQTCLLYAGSGSATKGPKRVLLLGIGDDATAAVLRRAAGAALRRARALGAKRVAIAAPSQRNSKPAAVAQALAEGSVLGAYRFDEFKPAPKPQAPPRSVSLFFERAPALAALRAAARDGVVIGESQNVARDLSNQPPNALPPAALAREARRVAREAGLRCKIMDVAELKKREMGALLAVGGGSVHTPRMIVMEHAPERRKRTGTLCLVGKGITFDTGGISIKPAGTMYEMKHDMSGAAAVVGAMRAVGLLKLPMHVVGIVAAAENMPGGKAYRPGDIVRSASGKTIEILNTDAEGRVVLADALHLAVSDYKPKAMVDLATLTGACEVALGPWASGLMGTDQALLDELQRAGEATGEIAWPLPLFDAHRRAMKSRVADLQNTGGRVGGASTAAGFLAAFVGDTPWAHLDIAGTAYTQKVAGEQPFGATGVGVRLLLEWLRGRRPGASRKRV